MEIQNNELEYSNKLQINLANRFGLSLNKFIDNYSSMIRDMLNIRDNHLKRGIVISDNDFEERCFTMCQLYKLRFLTKHRTHGILHD